MASAQKVSVVRWVSALLVLLSLTAAPILGEGGSCLELGYSSNLLCSSCRELKQFSLDALEEECKSCCQAEGASEDKVTWCGACRIRCCRGCILVSGTETLVNFDLLPIFPKGLCTQTRCTCTVSVPFLIGPGLGKVA